MQNGQNSPITYRVQKINALPGAFKRPCLGFSIPDDSRDYQIGVVESGAKGVGKDIAQLASFVNGAWGGHTDVSRDHSRGRKLPKQTPYPLPILGDLRIGLRVGPFEVHIGEDRRSTMSWSCQVDHIDILVLDESI